MDYAKELNQLPETFGLKVSSSGHRAKIRCPFHAGGNERTPSLSINLEGNYKGHWYCFGCGVKGSWNKLAKEIKLRRVSDNGFSDIDVPTIPDEAPQFEINGSEPVPNGFVWRNIRSDVLQKINARILYTIYGKKVYLPIEMYSETVGGITCAMKKSKTSYIYDKTPVHKYWFPFDYVASLSPSHLVLVEGPRDALNLIQNGIPALANLGGIYSWNEEKIKYVMDLDPKIVVLAFDPDEVGQKLTAAVSDKLRRLFQPHVRFEMNAESSHSEKEDPGNLTPERIAYLKGRINLLLRNQRTRP